MFRGTVSVAAILTMGVVLGCSDGASDLTDDAGAQVSMKTVNICPIVSTLDVSPLKTGINGNIALHATIADFEDETRQLKYRWFAHGGVLLGPISLHAFFQCKKVGIFTIAFAVEDRDGCFDYRTVVVECLETPTEKKDQAHHRLKSARVSLTDSAHTPLDSR